MSTPIHDALIAERTQTAPTVTPTRSGRGEARTPSSATAPGLADLPGWVVLLVLAAILAIVVCAAVLA